MELSDQQVKEVEASIGYCFKDKALLEQSLTHPSYLLRAQDQLKNNQRLEFLGDSVIQFVLTERLYHKFPEQREGPLTSLRSNYARRERMATLAKKLNLGTFLLLKPSDREKGIAAKESALGDVFEAVMGAIYLDSDWETCRAVVLRIYENLDTGPDIKEGISNPKGKLQEIIQPEHGNNALEYVTTAERGNPHEREFEVEVLFKSEPLGKGIGRTKKEAAEKAALVAIEKYAKRK